VLKDIVARLQTAFPYREQSKGEELANTISHAIGLVIASLGTPFMVLRALQQDSIGYLIGTCVFSATMIFLYLSSTLYHALPQGKAKRVFRSIEHSAILLLIAGTYTPFTLGVLSGSWGWSIFAVVWGLAVIGVTLKIIYQASHPILFTSLYLLMGWVIVIAIDPMLELVPAAGLLWLLAGGLCYTVGVAFFATDSQLKYGHFIWHLFVIAGTGCHYFSVFWYAA